MFTSTKWAVSLKCLLSNYLVFVLVPWHGTLDMCLLLFHVNQKHCEWICLTEIERNQLCVYVCMSALFACIFLHMCICAHVCVALISHNSCKEVYFQYSMKTFTTIQEYYSTWKQVRGGYKNEIWHEKNLPEKVNLFHVSMEKWT